MEKLKISVRRLEVNQQETLRSFSRWIAGGDVRARGRETEVRDRTGCKHHWQLPQSQLCFVSWADIHQSRNEKGNGFGLEP